MEPSISNKALGAVFVPREVVTEPWLVPIGYANSAMMYGAQILCGKEMVSATVRQSDGQGSVVWKVQTKQGDVFHARSIVNCGGLYGDTVDGMCWAQETSSKSARVRDSLLCSRVTNKLRQWQRLWPENSHPTCPNPANQRLIVWKSVRQHNMRPNSGGTNIAH